MIEPQVQTNELDRVHSVGQLHEHKTRAVLVKFATYASRQIQGKGAKQATTRQQDNIYHGLM